MGNTITIRLPEELAEWLKSTARKTGVPVAGWFVKNWNAQNEKTALSRTCAYPVRSMALPIFPRVRDSPENDGHCGHGFLVAFLNRRDRHHEWADEIGMRASEPLLTCDAVLAETIFQVGSVAEVLGLVQEGFLQLAFDLRGNLNEVLDLAERYRDRSPDLADLCLIRMSELYERLPCSRSTKRIFASIEGTRGT